MRGSPGLWIVSGLLLAAAGAADVLETRDGRILQGRYWGGTPEAVHFEVAGAQQVLPRDQVLTLRFAPGAPGDAPVAPATPTAEGASTTPAQGTAPVAPATATQGTAPAAPATATQGAAPVAPATPATTRVRVPAGTRLQVRLAESIDARLATAGDAFSARLETGLGLEGRPIVPAGSSVQGRVAEVHAGGAASSSLKLELTALLLEEQTLPLVTGSQSVAPPAAADPGAAAPPLAGIQAGTLMEFRLLQPVDLHILLP